MRKRRTRISLIPRALTATLLLASSSPASVVAYYEFNGGTNGAPVASASSTGGLTGTISGNLRYTTSHPPTPAAGSSALDATADFDFVRVPDNNLFHTPVFSVEVLFNPRYNAFTGDGILGHNIVNKLNTQSSGNFLSSYYLGYNQGAKQFFCAVGFGANTGVSIASSHSYNFNNWYDVVETYANNGNGSATLKLYVNGLLDASATFPYQAPFYSTDPLYIGAGNYSGENGTFRRNVIGYIDQVRITNDVLTPPNFLILPGDANGDSHITPDDYTLLDRGRAKNLSGWSNGDFNGDGVVNATDYLIIDQSYLRTKHAEATTLAATRVSQFGPDYVSQLLTSIPEPILLTACGAALLPITRRYRPRRSNSSRA